MRPCWKHGASDSSLPEAQCLGVFEPPDLQGLHAGGGTRTPDTRIMIGDAQGREGSEGPSQALEGPLSSAESPELGARLGARSSPQAKAAAATQQLIVSSCQ